MASNDHVPTGFASASDQETDPAAEPASLDIDPLELTGVGAGSAAIIKGSSFDASDIILKNVSYQMLLDAGITPRVAEKLRRAYSLVWTFYWEKEPDLAARADTVSGLTPAERDWVAASTSAVTRGPDEATVGLPSVERSRDRPGADSTDPAESLDGCPRCGGSLSVYAIGGDESIGCDDCGYVGIELTPPTS